VGVSVDPLGEGLAPMVLPEGFNRVLGPIGRAALALPTVLPEVPPLIDEPVVTLPPVAAGPPMAELPLAEPLIPCANANVLESARTEASAKVEIFMIDLPCMDRE